jgi:hypothetical protein
MALRREELHGSQSRRRENMVMIPAGLGTKNDSAGEDQQQITRQALRGG